MEKSDLMRIYHAECDASPSDVGYDPSALEELNRAIQTLMEEERIWSGSYALSRNGKVFADSTMGTLACNWCGHTDFTPDTLFELQSVGKVFTAIAVLKLMEEGRLSLDQPVMEWIPEFNHGEFREITILHLLTHTSGLCALDGTFPQDERRWWDFMNESDPGGTWLQAVVDTGLHARPGEKWIYSTIAYIVLGEIIRRASGEDPESFIEKNIFLPCDMKDTHWRRNATPEQIRRYNVANETDLGMVKQCMESDPEMVKNSMISDTDLEMKQCKGNIMLMAAPTYPVWDGIPDTAGGQMSTCREMLHLGEMILNGGIYHGTRVIGEEALSYLWTPMTGPSVHNISFGRDEAIIYGAGMPIYSSSYDHEQVLSEGTIYHEGAGTCVFLVDRSKNFTAMFQTSFRHEFDWDERAVKGLATIIHSGIL